jgi:hypothetical protein
MFTRTRSKILKGGGKSFHRNMTDGVCGVWWLRRREGSGDHGVRYVMERRAWGTSPPLFCSKNEYSLGTGGS